MATNDERLLIDIGANLSEYKKDMKDLALLTAATQGKLTKKQFAAIKKISKEKIANETKALNVIIKKYEKHLKEIDKINDTSMAHRIKQGQKEYQAAKKQSDKLQLNAN